MVVPAGAATFAEALRIGAEVYHALKAVLHERGLATAVGDEGGFAPDLPSSEAAIEAILEAAERAGHRDARRDRARPGDERGLPRRRVPLRGPRARRPASCPASGRSCVARYPIVSIEDGAAEDDWDAWKQLTAELGDRVQLVGDDLFVTNPERLQRGIDEGVGNSILVKVNQIGTLTETLEAIATRARRRLHGGHLAPLGRDRGHDDRRPRGRHERRPDQDGRARALRSRREVQPAPAHRGGARRAAAVSRAGHAFPRRRADAAPGDRLTWVAWQRVLGGRRSWPRSGRRSATHESFARSPRPGMDAARLNFSHGTHEEHAARAALVREVQAELGRPLALIADLQGPKLRIGGLDGPRILVDRRRGRRRRRQPARATASCRSRPPSIAEVLEPGHDVLIDDGLRPAPRRGGRRRPRALHRRRRRRGQVEQGRQPARRRRSRSRRSPRRTSTTSSSRSASASTTSRSRSSARPTTSASCRRSSASAARAARVIAKIEKAEAVEALDEILAEADGADGRPRRPRRRDRRRDGAADPEADHPRAASRPGSR